MKTWMTLSAMALALTLSFSSAFASTYWVWCDGHAGTSPIPSERLTFVSNEHGAVVGKDIQPIMASDGIKYEVSMDAAKGPAVNMMISAKGKDRAGQTVDFRSGGNETELVQYVDKARDVQLTCNVMNYVR